MPNAPPRSVAEQHERAGADEREAGAERLHVHERRPGDHEAAEHEEDDRDADARGAEERVEPVGDRRPDDAAVPFEPGDDGEEETQGEEAEADELGFSVRPDAARAYACARGPATSGEPETDASSAPCSGMFRGAAGRSFTG